MISRRRFAQSAGLAAIGCGLALASRPVPAAAGFSDRLAADLVKTEAESGGRLGVAALDTLTGARSLHRADERFPMCSTFKVLAAGAVLARVDAGTESLDRRVRFQARDLVEYSPITKDHAGGDGMSVADLLRSRPDPERQYGGKSAARRAGRARRINRLCALAGRLRSHGSTASSPT